MDVPSTSAPPPPWTELPRDVTAIILHRLGPIEILESAQEVCTTWKDVCLEPAMWRVIDMKDVGYVDINDLQIMCCDAVDRSQGQLIEISIKDYGDDDLIRYISERSSHLKCLRLACCYGISGNGLSEAVKKFPQLEELHLSLMSSSILSEHIESIGRSCPMLKSFTFRRDSEYPLLEDIEAEDIEYARAIAKTMPNLHHLGLLGDHMTNEGLQAILDNCPHLESLDVRECFNIDLGGYLGKRLSRQMKNLRHPSDSSSDYESTLNTMKGNKFKLERPKINKKSRKGVSSSSAPRPPWVELPRDVTANILHRLGAIEILESARRVCTTWRSVCLEPAMWRVIDMRNLGDLHDMPYDLEIMCRHAVDRSQGQLIEINIEYFGTDELIHYITERSPLLKHLKLANCYNIEGEELSEAVKKIPQLEELHLTYMTSIDAEYIESIGRSCPMLKSFTYNYRWYNHNYPFPESSEAEEMEYAQAVAKTMPNLCHLALLGDQITNERLIAILDNCPHLESLDIRQCKNIDLGGDLEKRLSKQIKTLRRPSDSTADYGWIVNDDDSYTSDIY
ncbi:hypothetical protein ACJIZ3_008428 [Penstemon smallii]|uniref:F-box domain-containing protein n=1 Tax=Penstemon smallii TaxID=265156 RepID=A0ABD3TBF8_9LAMI